jgi:hypothetical protein
MPCAVSTLARSRITCSVCSPTPSETSREIPARGRMVAGGAVGTLMEYYDYYLYGLASAAVIAVIGVVTTAYASLRPDVAGFALARDPRPATRGSCGGRARRTRRRR